MKHKRTRNKRLFGNITLLVTAMIWGSAFVAQKAAPGAGIGPLTFCAARYVLATIGMCPVISWTQRQMGLRSINPFALSSFLGDREKQKAHRKELLKAGFLTGFFMFGGTAFQQIALITTSAGKTAFLTCMYVVFVPLGSLLIWKKKPGQNAWFGVLFGILGLFFLSFASGITKGELAIAGGDLIVLLCAVFWAGQILTIDHYMEKGLIDGIRMAQIQYAVTGLFSVIAMFLFETPHFSQVWACWIPILYTAIGSTVIGFTLQIIGQRYTTPAAASLIMSLESVFGALSGALFLHEKMALREWLGALFLFAGIVISQLPNKKASEIHL